MLAGGASYAYIVRTLGEHNAKCDRRDQVTIDSVRNHCARHFPVQQVARATYRKIVEQRAEQNRVDFVNGVATALTPLACFEVLMNKAFRSLVDDDTEVSVDTGLRALRSCSSCWDRQDHGDEIAEMRLQVNQILNAVKAVVPQSMWDEIVEKLDHSIKRRSTLKPSISTTGRTPTIPPSSPRTTSCNPLQDRSLRAADPRHQVHSGATVVTGIGRLKPEWTGAATRKQPVAGVLELRSGRYSGVAAPYSESHPLVWWMPECTY